MYTKNLNFLITIIFDNSPVIFYINNLDDTSFKSPMIFKNLINIDNFANNKKNADQHRNELGLPFIYRLKQFLIFF